MVLEWTLGSDVRLEVCVGGIFYLTFYCGKWNHKVLVQELKPASLGRIVQAKNAFRGKK